MAKLKLGSIITDASGKLGGHQIGRNKGTVILQNSGVKNYVVSNSQNLQRRNTQEIMSNWSLLSDAQRLLWREQVNSYIELNNFSDFKQYSPFGLFNKINQGRMSCGLELLSIPNPVAKPRIPQELNVTATITEIIIQSNSYTENELVNIYASKGLSSGISKPKKYMRKIAVVSGTDLVSGVDIFDAYINKFGAIVEEQSIFFGNKTYSASSGYSNGDLLINSNATIVGNVIDPILLSGLVSYWNPETIDPTATVENDPINIWSDSVNSNDATQSGSLRPVLHISSSGQRQVRFDGSNDYLNVGQPSNLLFVPTVDAFTIVCIIGENPPTQGYLISNASSSIPQRRYGVFVELPDEIGSFAGPGAVFVDLAENVKEGDIFLMTASASTQILRFNGNVVDSRPTDSGGSDVDINIGARSNGGWLYDGDIERIAVYNRVLTPEEIADIEDYYS